LLDADDDDDDDARARARRIDGRAQVLGADVARRIAARLVWRVWRVGRWCRPGAFVFGTPKGEEAVRVGSSVVESGC